MSEDKIKQLIKAVNDFPGDLESSSAKELVDWVESLCPWIEELHHQGELYEIWVGIDSATLVDIGRFNSYGEASDHAWKIGVDMYESNETCPTLETFMEETNDPNAAYSILESEKQARIVMSIKKADMDKYAEANGNFETYYDLVVSEIEPTWPEERQ